MKANPSHAVLGLFHDLGLHIDASSDPEVERALRAGFAPGRIQLTSQVPSRRLEEFVALGVLYNACSLHQLDRYGRAFPGGAAIIRVNPGLGSGSTKRTNTGGPASSFGIWHAYLDEAKTLAARHRLTIRGLHTHIGSGSDPAVWTRVAGLVLEIVERLPDVTTVSLGGGFKVARVAAEQATDLATVGAAVREAFVEFQKRTGRRSGIWSSSAVPAPTARRCLPATTIPIPEPPRCCASATAVSGSRGSERRSSRCSPTSSPRRPLRARIRRPTRARISARGAR